ncbi:MAG: bifunctional homocysteine S-methyltransferase/methylenetetrahydrofolate reductase [Candidatus Tectomicrobia bacterium]|uniref:Bifunctional homocysteine S-methyltransferase/methylenetetrahydrofolate reductase n=1 Tax=Tectimicrobiota bacterium TaxID=2528274 RepID=A0A932CP57_UNCTE|nr:bifunctional homocysteine S-methyltransferase/methylenetetrahydrofolate reductase [Candidatus Tectomicrobia bacterium]
MRDSQEIMAEDRVYVFDGAMGTMLYSRGIYINRCYDELNLSNPELVRGIHRDYVKAGADIIETNTFGANRVKLSAYGMEDKMREINLAGVRLAREAAEDHAWVAGAISALGIHIEPYGPTSVEEAQAYFREQAEALLEGGVDLFVLETFSDVAEIYQALRAVRSLTNLPIVAQMTIQNDGNTSYGTSPEIFTQRLDEWGAEVIGLNCSVGPHLMLEAIEKMREATQRKLSAQPNGGMPRGVEGRMFYMASPEYMAEYAMRLIQVGVKFVGGCCGTTPDHIKWIANAVAALSPGRSSFRVVVSEERPPDVEVTPRAHKSGLARKVCEGKFVTSVEIVPPRGCDASWVLESVGALKEAGVDAVNVPDGPRAQSRMGVVALSALIEQQVGIEAVVHYCCRDRNLLGMTSDLLGAAALGLRNLLLITGDPPKMGPYPEATAVFDIDSIGLVNMVSRLNHGLDIGGNPIGKPTSFYVGVGVNPCAVDLELELRRFQHKVEAGAEFAITQPTFDVEQLRSFLKKIEHVRIPVIAGIWPLVSYRNAEFLANEVPGVKVPGKVLDRMRSAGDKEAAREEGLAIARETLLEVRDLVQGAQVSAPFGKVQYALDVFSVLDA